LVKCRLCGSNDADLRIEYARLPLCKGCFTEKFFPNRLRRTVKKYRMFSPAGKVAVALSGGKDSAVLIHSLKKAFPELKTVGVHLDLGIEGYSEEARQKVEEICSLLDVELIVYSLKDEEGFTVDDFRKTSYKRKICSVCGVLKRRRLSRIAASLDVEALLTGHNLDDIVENMMSCFLSKDFQQLVRLKSVLPEQPPLPKKVKPLSRVYEVETLMYAQFLDLPFMDLPCPYASGSRSLRRKQLMNMWEHKQAGFKYQLFSAFEEIIPIIEANLPKTEFIRCKICGLPSSSPVCSDCRRVSLIKETLSKI